MGGGSAVGSSQQPLPDGSGGACVSRIAREVMHHRARSHIIACGHAPLRAVCIVAVCKLPTDLASRWWLLRCRRLVAVAPRRQRQRRCAEPRARGHTSLRSALRAVMHRARSCIIACGHASMRYVSSHLLSARAVAPPAAARSSPP
eukprot:scaffold19137_cov41-Phaeocystis_antarctica.AAC.5